MALERLILKNFQCHRMRVVDFDPLVTTLVGRTDSGKSTILRATRWVMCNNLSGVRIAHWDSDYAKVILGIDDHEITRYKGKDKNTYVLDDKVFSAVRTDVPEEVANILNVSDDNFQKQLDSPYWFLETPGEVSRQLNRIVNLDTIDNTLADAAAEVKATKVAVTSCEARLAEAERTKNDLSWSIAMDEDLKTIETEEVEQNSTQLKLTRLSTAITIASSCQNTAVNASGALRQGSSVLKEVEIYMAAQEKLSQLQILLHKIQQLEANRQQSGMDTVLAETQLENKMGGQCPVCKQPIKKGALV
jgi:DNA repair protein SbcC/Rad50